jgi:hypothetical protein
MMREFASRVAVLPAKVGGVLLLLSSALPAAG